MQEKMKTSNNIRLQLISTRREKNLQRTNVF